MDIDAAFEQEGIQIPYPTTHEMRSLPEIAPEILAIKKRARRSAVRFMRKEGMLLEIEQEDRRRAEEVRGQLLRDLERGEETPEDPPPEDSG